MNKDRPVIPEDLANLAEMERWDLADSQEKEDPMADLELLDR